MIKKILTAIFLTLILLPAGDPVLVNADASQTRLIYQQKLRDYATAQSVFTAQKVNYSRSNTPNDLEKTVETATTLMQERDEVNLSFLDWLDTQIDANLPDEDITKTDFLVSSESFKQEFQSHEEDLALVEDTLSWYSADDNYLAIKNRYGGFSYQVFATLYYHRLDLAFKQLQYLYDEQSATMLDKSASVVIREDTRRGLESIQTSLADLNTRVVTLQNLKQAVRDKTSYDNFKMSADMFYSQLLKSSQSFDSLWQGKR